MAQQLLTPLGLRDINSARRRITERYIRNCDEIFAVCNIIRATTDEGVKAVVELANKASLSNVGIICTRSDVSREPFSPTTWTLLPDFPSRISRPKRPRRTGKTKGPDESLA